MVITSFVNLKNLTVFSGLVQLKLINCPVITDVSCLKNVQKLTISNCSLVEDVSALGNIPELEIDGCQSIKDITSLSSNRSLSIHECHGITQVFPVFHGIKFNCYVNSALDEKDRFLSFPNLKYFKLSFHKINDNLLPDYALIFGNLFTLELNTCLYLTSLKGTKGIRRVYLTNCHKLEDISDLGENQVVSIRCCPNIRDFSSLRKVLKVSIDNCEGFTNCHDVENVYHLTIRDCSSFTNPQMLGKVYHLELYTFVDGFEGLRNIPILEIDFYSDVNRGGNYFKSLGGTGNTQIIFPHGYFPSYHKEFPCLGDYRIVSTQYEDYRSKCILIGK
jgi:hypothetical protein